MTLELKAKIDAMDRVEMARTWRYAPIGSVYFQDEAGDYFKKRFSELGGFSPEISKAIDGDR